jgi:predicted nucleic acid-binding protein
MQTVLIDTDIAIDYLRGHKEAIELIAPLWEENRAYLSILSVYELYAGMREKEKDDTEVFIKACNIEPVTMKVARTAGELYRKSRATGMTLTSIDCLIAATAVVGRHKIATRNKDHYPDTLLYV